MNKSKIVKSFKKGSLDVSLWINYTKNDEPYFKIAIKNGYKTPNGWRNPTVTITPNQANAVLFGLKEMVDTHYKIINKNRKAFAKKKI